MSLVFITTASEHLDDNDYITSADNPSTRWLCIGQCGLKWGNVIKATMTAVVDNERAIVQPSIEEEGLHDDLVRGTSSDRWTHPIIRLRNDLHAHGVLVHFTANSLVGRSSLCGRAVR